MSLAERSRRGLCWLLGSLLLSLGCQSQGSSRTIASTSASATAPGPLAEPAVTLSPEAARRLGVQLSEVRAAEITTGREFVGEVVVPPGRSFSLTAPVAAVLRLSASARMIVPGAVVEANAELARLVPLAPADRDLRAQSSRLVALARARVELARQRVRRTEAMLQRRAASARSLEEAQAEQSFAEAELRAASDRASSLARDPMSADVQLVVRAPTRAIVRAVHGSHGQSLAAGALIFELLDASVRWVRVPVASVELERFDRASQCRAGLSGGAMDFALRRIHGPPTADFASATVDRWFELRDAPEWPPATRVSVRAVETSPAHPTVPTSALLLDTFGGASVYVERAPLQYVRRPVVVRSMDGATASLSVGPPLGARVVVTAVSELAGLDAPGGH